MNYKLPTKKQAAAYFAAACEILDKCCSFAKYPAKGEAEYKINTVAGSLRVTVYDDWLACRFDNVAAAKAALPEYAGLGQRYARLNPFSGKWNWHGADALPAFDAALQKIIAKPVDTTL